MKWKIHIMNLYPTILVHLRYAIIIIWTKFSEEFFWHILSTLPQTVKAGLKAKEDPGWYELGLPCKAWWYIPVYKQIHSLVHRFHCPLPSDKSTTSSFFMWPQLWLIFAYLKLAMGLTLSPLISTAWNWNCLSSLSDDGALIRGCTIGWDMPWCGTWWLQDTEGRANQEPVMVGGEGEAITDVTRGHLNCISLTPFFAPTLIWPPTDIPSSSSKSTKTAIPFFSSFWIQAHFCCYWDWHLLIHTMKAFCNL